MQSIGVNLSLMSLEDLWTGGAWPALARVVRCALNCVNVARPTSLVGSNSFGKIGYSKEIAGAEPDERVV